MAELENHLRLEPRGDHAVKREAEVTSLGEMDGLGIHVRPDWLTHLEPIPHGAIGKADLAADRLVSSFQEPIVEYVPDLIAAVEIKTDFTLRW